MGKERKHSRFSLLLSFELLCRYFFGHIHTWKTVSSFFRSPYPFCCTPNIAFCVSMSGGRRRISRRLIRLFLFFLSSMAVSREKNEEREEQQHTLSHMCAKGRKERKKGENMRRQLAAQFEGSCKSGRKRGKRTNVLARDAIQRKTRRFSGFFSLICFRFPCMQMLFPHSSFLCANFLSLSHKYIFEKRGRRKEREKIIMSPFPFSPPPVHSNFHTVKSFLLFSHFFGKRNKKRERHLNGGREKGDILLLLLLLLSKLRTSHGDPQNEFYKVGGGSEKTTPLGQVFTHKV